MATQKSTSTRKASTTRAAASTSTSTADPAPTPDPAPAETPEPAAPAADPAPAEQPPPPPTPDPAPSESTDESASDDPAAALKKKIRTTQHIGDTRPDELTDQQRANLAGPPIGAVGGPRTLASMTSPTRVGEEYVHAPSEGHIAFVPERLKQSSTKRVWVQGQHVRKDVFDAMSPFVAPTPAEARVLSDEEYAQVAPYL